MEIVVLTAVGVGGATVVGAVCGIFIGAFSISALDGLVPQL